MRRSSPGAGGSDPDAKPGPGERGAPKPSLGDRKPSPHPASSPTAGTRLRNRGKGNLVFSCFALNPFLSPSSGQLLGSPHPAPTPDARSGASQPPPPAPPPPSWLRWSLTPACAQRPGTRRWTLPRTPPSPGRVPCTRGADGSIPSPSGALTARPPPRPPSAELTDAPQVAQGSDALSLARGPRLTCC